MASGEWNSNGSTTELVAPSPAFSRGVGERPRSRGAQSVVDVYGADGMERNASYVSLVGLAPPQPEFTKKEKRRSRQDIWR